jgi:FxsC-like protein
VPTAPETSPEATPCFFLSHARRRTVSPLVRRFQRELEERVRALASDRGRAAPSIDSELPVGGRWPEQVARGLASCRVFVALYSDEYFASEHSGREWQAFTSRLGSDHVVPVLWQPVRADSLPQGIPRVRGGPAEPGPTYLEYGLNYLLRHLPEHREEYNSVLRLLALRIVEIGARSPSERPERYPDYQSVPDAFASRAEPVTSRARIRIVIAAPATPDLPPGADAEMYGPDPTDWKPYLPDFRDAIGQTARRVAESMDFRTHIETLEDGDATLPGRPPTSPALLIIDPWSLRVPSLRLLLSAFDSRSHREPWVRPVVAWNRDHPSSKNHVIELVDALATTLPRCRRRYRPDSPRVLDGLETAHEFLAQLPVVIGTAERRYLSEIGRDLADRTEPEAAARLPRLRGPGPGFTAGGADRLPDTEVQR